MERKDEAKEVEASIEIYLGGKWKPRKAIIPISVYEKMENNEVVMMLDEDKQEIFVRKLTKGVPSN